MSTPWTPGPWEISGQKTIRTKRHDGRLDGWVARANWQNGVANARLIAAAPEMAAVLEELASDLEAEINARYGTAPSHTLEIYRRERDMGPVYTARALLARIKGKAK
jgi:hypothetical protein